MRMMTVTWTLLIGTACGTGSVETMSDQDQTTGQYPVVCMEESPAHEIFQSALCVCGNLGDTGDVSVESTSTDANGDVGVNGNVDFTGSITVAGALVTQHELDWVGDLAVLGSMTVGGAVDGVGSLVVGGTLRHGGSLDIVGEQSINAIGPYAAPEAPPCSCDGLDVAAAVAQAAADEDTAVLGASNVGDAEMTLTSGSYYLESLEAVGSIHFIVDGEVSVFIGGPVETVGAQHFELMSDGQLDLYVAGDMESIGTAELGNPDAPAALRLYVGGTEPIAIDSVGDSRFYGSIYAPTAALEYVGDQEIVGAVLVERVNGTGDLLVRHDRLGDPESPECSGEEPSEPSNPPPM